MRRYQTVFAITDEQRGELSKWAASRTLPAGDVFRARLILALAEGAHTRIMQTLQTTAPTISRWKQRFEEHGIAGLARVTKGASRAWPMQRRRLASLARRSRSLPTVPLIGRAGKWPRRWA
jgi:hypothetical protein